MKVLKRITTFAILLVFCLGMSACTISVKTGHEGETWISTDNQTNAYFISNTKKVELTEQSKGNSDQALYINMVKNEKEGGQFFIRNNFSELSNVHAEISDLINDNGHVIKSKEYSRIGKEGTTENYVMIFREHYSKIEHVVDTPTYYMPDALVPLYDDNNSVSVKAGENQGFYVSVKTMPEDPAGVYKGYITITHSNGNMKIPVYVTVNDVTLPDVSNCKSLILNWNISDAYDGTDIDWIEAKEMLMYFLLDNRMNIDWLPGSQGTWLDEYKQTVEKYATDPRVQSFHMPFFGEVMTREDGTQYYYINADKTKQWRAEMEKLGVLDKCYYYEFDEIGTEDKYQLAREMHQQLMAIDPNIKNLITLFSGTAPMYGNLSVWCTGRKGTTQEFINTIYNTGTKEVWWYGTEERQIGIDNLTQAKNLFWTQKQLGIVGYLDWAADCYNYFSVEEGYHGLFNCWEEPCQYVPDKGYSNYGGDSFLVYPGKVGDGIVNRNEIVSSLRFEAVRDGIEDYDLLTIRESQIQEKLNAKGITEYTAKDFMNIYYDGMNNSVNLETNTVYSESDRYEKLRALLIRDIAANNDMIVGMKTYTDSDNFMLRDIYVLSDKDVTVNGQSAKLNNGIYCTTVACKTAEVEINVHTEQISLNYYVYPKIITDVKTIFDMSKDGAELVESLGSSSIEYRDGRVYFDASNEEFIVPSDIWKGTNNWSDNQFISLNIKNEGDTVIDSIDVYLSGRRSMTQLSTKPLQPGEERTVYLDYISNAELGSDVEKLEELIVLSDGSAEISIGYINICTIK